MARTDESISLTVEASDGTTDGFEIPAALLDRLAEGDEPAARVVTDVAVTAFTGRAHALVHHDHGEVDGPLQAAERTMLERFENRFGVSYGEATGHSH